jgi:hypothetical protein
MVARHSEDEAMTARDALLASVTERDWQATVIDLAHLNRWTVFHVPDSRGMTAGLPDLILIRPPELLFVELKTEHGRLRPAQTVVLDALTDCGCECHVWRPHDQDRATQRLAHQHRGRP